MYSIEIIVDDGARGWLEHAPFERIILTAAPEHVPRKLVEQLKPGGRMVLPLGSPDEQTQICIDRGHGGEMRQRELNGVRFSPLVACH